MGNAPGLDRTRSRDLNSRRGSPRHGWAARRPGTVLRPAMPGPVLDRSPPSEPECIAGDRRLIAAVHADVVGYSRLVELDDLATCTRLGRMREELIRPLLRRHGGHLINAVGDAALMGFDSITAAVAFAVEMQVRVPQCDGAQPSDRLIRYRVGVDVGDVIMGNADVCGEGVNIAARLQAVCPPGCVCVSRAVLDLTRARLGLPFEFLGLLSFKNISHPVEAFILAGLAERSLEIA